MQFTVASGGAGLPIIIWSGYMNLVLVADNHSPRTGRQTMTYAPVLAGYHAAANVSRSIPIMNRTTTSVIAITTLTNHGREPSAAVLLIANFGTTTA